MLHKDTVIVLCNPCIDNPCFYPRPVIKVHFWGHLCDKSFAPNQNDSSYTQQMYTSIYTCVYICIFHVQLYTYTCMATPHGLPKRGIPALPCIALRRSTYAAFKCYTPQDNTRYCPALPCDAIVHAHDVLRDNEIKSQGNTHAYMYEL